MKNQYKTLSAFVFGVCATLIGGLALLCIQSFVMAAMVNL